MSKKKIINIVCVENGNYCGRGEEYVSVLFDMVHRNISNKTAYKFHCFTDREQPFSDDIIFHRLPDDLTGWWAKLYLFKSGVFERGEHVLFFDLDTVIVSGIDELLKYNGDFAILRDFYRPNGLQSSVMAWKVGKETEAIWDKWIDAGSPVLAGGDQEWIENCITNPDIWQDELKGFFYSYKVSARFDIPKEAKVICFHGKPRPHEETGNWVPHVWKIGGGSSLELKSVLNVSRGTVLRNIRKNLKRDHEMLDEIYPDNDKTLCICGGGPSLNDNIEELIAREKNGAIIWGLNNSFNFLKDNGVNPHAQLLLDARPQNKEFVPQNTRATMLYATSCHPGVFDKASENGNHIYMWNAYEEGMLALLGKRKAALIGGSTTVGMCALSLAAVFGFRDVHLYGYDSSYKDNDNHAYPQKLNDNEKIIDVHVNGRHFRCAPWMADQTERFKEISLNLISEYKMSFTIHGDGLLPYVASLMAAA